jgi:hypothetical protein
VGIVEAPCDGVEHARDAVLGDAAAEERVALEGAECVVLNLCVRGGCALADEVEVYVCIERRNVEEDEPGVDAQVGL